MVSGDINRSSFVVLGAEVKEKINPKLEPEA
jgi:hypothetical protein